MCRLWSTTTPSSLSTTWPHSRPRPACRCGPSLRGGRRGRLMRRVAPPGISPDSLRRAWATTCPSRETSASSSASVAKALAGASSPARRSPRRALAATPRASARLALGDASHFPCDRLWLFFCRAGKAPQPCPDVVRPRAHRPELSRILVLRQLVQPTANGAGKKPGMGRGKLAGTSTTTWLMTVPLASTPP